MIKQRDVSIDFIKSIAIFSVILGHLLERSMGTDNFFRNVIYSFHMPLFFMASGILAGNQVPEVNYIIKKSINKCRLLIPLISVGSIYTLCVGNYSYHDFLFSWGKNGYWFMLALFEIFILYYIANLISIKIKNKIIEGFILLLPYFLTIWIKNTSIQTLANYLVLICCLIIFILSWAFTSIDINT